MKSYLKHIKMIAFLYDLNLYDIDIQIYKTNTCTYFKELLIT